MLDLERLFFLQTLLIVLVSDSNRNSIFLFFFNIVEVLLEVSVTTDNVITLSSDSLDLLSFVLDVNFVDNDIVT